MEFLVKMTQFIQLLTLIGLAGHSSAYIVYERMLQTSTPQGLIITLPAFDRYINESLSPELASSESWKCPDLMTVQGDRLEVANESKDSDIEPIKITSGQDKKLDPYGTISESVIQVKSND
jgi:hypothetical protein